MEWAPPPSLIAEPLISTSTTALFQCFPQNFFAAEGLWEDANLEPRFSPNDTEMSYSGPAGPTAS